MPYKIQSIDAIKFGWNLFKTNPVLFIGLAFINVILSQDYGKHLDLPKGMSAFLALAISIVSVLATAGMIKIFIRYIRGDRNVSFSNLFDIRDPMQLLKFLGASILLGIIILIGFVLFIVPGVYLMLKYYYVPYLIVDRNMGISEAFKKSAQMTEGVKMDLLVFGLLCFGVLVLGFVAFIVGVLVAMPVVTLASVYIYNELLNYAEHNERSAEPVTGTIEAAPVA